jgi:hypothetical protein
MIILGAFLKKKPIISIDAIIEGLKKVLPERYHNLIPSEQRSDGKRNGTCGECWRECLNKVREQGKRFA